MTATVEIRKGESFSSTPGNRRPWRDDYRATGPDGAEWQNGSLVTLKRLMGYRYGRLAFTVVNDSARLRAHP